jgi:putative 4-mercaptohistidine N1-methyltranferase
MPEYYNTPEQLNEYLVFHYGIDKDILKWDFGPKQALGFHQRLVNCIDSSQLSEESRALDLGCSVGRISFELARHIGSVVGIDYSHQFIEAAKNIQNSGRVEMHLKREGALGDKIVRDFGNDIDLNRVAFNQGDAERLPQSIGTFDVIVLANILDRLPHPRNCLRNLKDLTQPGGQLIICSPFTWWDEFTEPGERLGGYMEGENEVTSLDTMKLILNDHFQLENVRDQPFLIREHERKFHFSVAETTVWTRR